MLGGTHGTGEVPLPLSVVNYGRGCEIPRQDRIVVASRACGSVVIVRGDSSIKCVCMYLYIMSVIIGIPLCIPYVISHHFYCVCYCIFSFLLLSAPLPPSPLPPSLSFSPLPLSLSHSLFSLFRLPSSPIHSSNPFSF